MKKILVLLVLSIVMMLCVGCTNTNNEGSRDNTESESTTDIGNSGGTYEPETTQGVSRQGWYTLDECKSKSGVFISYSDESFDRYPTGGYCHGLKSGERYFNGMFMKNSSANSVPENAGDIDLVVFASGEYSLALYPIHEEVRAFTTSLESDSGVLGYGQLTQVNPDTACISIIYENHESVNISPMTINGEPSSKYQAEHIVWEVTPYKGMSTSKYKFELWGFKKDATVTLGIGVGTTLTESTYSVDATYYDCYPDHNNWQDEDIYVVNCVPTARGYAKIDLSDVPAGKYIMLFREGRSYRATVITIK